MCSISFQAIKQRNFLRYMQVTEAGKKLISILWGAILDIITNFYNICSTSNLPAKRYIEYSHCYIFVPNSIYICYVLQKSFLCFHTVLSTLLTVWYDAPRAGFSKIDPGPSWTFFAEAKNDGFMRYSRLRE